MARRYSYTPRRGGRSALHRRPARKRSGEGNSYAGLFIPIAIAVALVGFGLLVSGGSAEFPDQTTCEGDDCTPLVAGDATSPVPTTQSTAQPAVTAEQRTGTEPAPVIDGYAASVIEAPCGVQLYGLNEDLQLPPASLTKMMTALVALEQSDPEEVIDVTIDGGELSLALDSTIMGLRPGDRLPLLDLLYGLIMRSGLDAAVTIAEHIAGDEDSYAELMNIRAAVLGLTQTHFANASGLDDPNLYTTAYDIARLGNAVLQNETLAEIVGSLEYQPAWNREGLDNKNLFLTNYPGAVGVKTGYTENAEQTIVAAADKNGRRLIVSVLHTEDMYVDSALLLDWAFANTSSAC
jgi:D-alanyl-D-alanine carboxypeptidase (penicillin-binding protein 5/6)